MSFRGSEVQRFRGVFSEESEVRTGLHGSYCI